MIRSLDSPERSKKRAADNGVLVCGGPAPEQRAERPANFFTARSSRCSVRSCSRFPESPSSRDGGRRRFHGLYASEKTRRKSCRYKVVPIHSQGGPHDCPKPNTR